MPVIACQVCGSALANYACGQCGARVCEKHFDLRAGVCRACRGGKRWHK